MSSNWIKTTIKYALLLTPAFALIALIALVATGAWVAAILHEPARYAEAPALIRTLTRATYWHTRTHWHTVPECVIFDPDLLYRPRPGSCVFTNSEFRTTMHFDARGARRTPDPLPPAEPTAGRPRLVIVGDSHAMGWGFEDHETFASVLASAHGYRTVNLAVSSYGTPRELLRLERDFALEPDDLVIIQYCDNDLAEGRHFLESGRVGPYQPGELDALFAYEPTPASAMPVAGLLLRLGWKDFWRRLGGRRTADGARAASPTDAFLHALASHPVLHSRRVIVVAINGPGIGTHLSADRLAAAGISLLVPALGRGDFFAIDDHMLAQGHAKVANQLAEAAARLEP